jgi:hypothetical protein
MSSATTSAGTAPGDHDDVLELDVGALDRVQRAGERLGERGVGRRQVLADLVHQRLDRVDHVLRHPAGVAPLEPEHVVGSAHPVLATQAVAALPAGHDLLGDHAVTHRDAPPVTGLLVEADDLADELVPGNDLGLRPGGAVLVAPELRRAVIALQVARADADGLHTDQGLTGARHGNHDLLEPVVLGAVADHRSHLLRHRVRDGLGHVGLLRMAVPAVSRDRFVL